MNVGPWTEFGLRKGECFIKNHHFPAFFFSDNDFLFTNRTNFVCSSTSPKISESWTLEVAKALKLTLSQSDPLKL